MGSHAPVDYSAIVAAAPRTAPKNITMMAIAFLGLGLVAAFFGFMNEPLRAQATFIINFVYFGGIAQGSFMFAVVMVLTNCRWGRPIKRLAEVIGLFLIPLYLMLIVFLLAGGIELYPWMHEDLSAYAHKSVYLTKDFFIARQVCGIGLLIVLDLILLRASWRADMAVAAKTLSKDKVPAFWSSFTAGWGSDDSAEIAKAFRTQLVVAPVLVASYALLWSMVAVDLSMSLAPHWYANMFPAWYCMSSFWTALVFIGILSHALR